MRVTASRLCDWTVPADVEARCPSPHRRLSGRNRLDSVESLYLAGLHLEQYRHATREPADYYREGLRRDPGDARCNTALGKLLYRRGRFAEAEPYLRRAIERLTRHNPNPYDGEPYFCSVARSNDWNVTSRLRGLITKPSGTLPGRTQVTLPWHVWMPRGQLDRALEYVNRCLARNSAHRQSRHLKVTLLRLLDRPEAAKSLAQDWLQRRRLPVGTPARVDDARQGQPESDCRSIVLRPNARRPTQLS